MIYLLEAAPLEAGKDVIEAAKNGEVGQLIHQAITMGMEAGKSLLLALVIFFVGRYAIKFINTMHIINLFLYMIIKIKPSFYTNQNIFRISFLIIIKMNCFNCIFKVNLIIP